jgi:hypothetical protein
LSDVTFSGGKLGVTGQLSASLGVSGTTFHGAGGAITDLDADNITAGSLSAARLDLASAGGLENNSDSLQINLSGTASGLSLDSDGLQIDIATLGSDSGFDTGKEVIIQDSSNVPKRMTFNVIQAGLTIQGSQLGGTIANARLPTAISQPFITGSTAVSGAFFFGDGAGLTNVTSTPSPVGSNTQIQFNDDGALAADAELTFLTGSNTLATSNLSASVNISGSSLFVQDEIIVGGQTFVNSEGNIAAVGEVTASGDISSSLDVHALNFRGNGSTLNNVPLGSSNAASIVFINNAGNQTITTNADFTFNGTHAVNTGGGFKGTILSASGDLEVGGNITSDTGDLDVSIAKAKRFKLLSSGSAEDTLLDLTSGSYAGTGFSTISMFNSASNALRETVTVTSDTLGLGPFFRLQTNAATPAVQVQMYQGVISASSAISGSSIHFANSPSAVISSGGNTFLDNDGNIFTGGITMQDGAGVKLNFNDNEISGSGHVSASAFFGDASGLTNVPARTLVSYQSRIFLSNSTERFFCFAGSTTAQAAPSSDQHRSETTFIAPASGTLRQISITTFGANAGNTSVIAACYKNGDYTSVVTHTTGALEPGGGDGGRQLPVLSNNFTNTFDMTSGSIGTPLAPGAGNVFVSGTVPFDFDPNDSLHFGFKFADGNNLIYGSINLLFELDSTDIP